MNRRAGNWEQGMKDLENALKLDPRNKAIAFQLAEFYLMTPPLR